MSSVSQENESVQETIKSTESKIKDGLSKPTASTGTPMKDLVAEQDLWHNYQTLAEDRLLLVVAV